MQPPGLKLAVSPVIHLPGMSKVSTRDLRNHGGEVIDRAARGEQITITRSGRPVAEMRALSRPPLSADALLGRWSRLPAVDPVGLRADIRSTH